MNYYLTTKERYDLIEFDEGTAENYFVWQKQNRDGNIEYESKPYNSITNAVQDYDNIITRVKP